jgi:hypothetical protein
VGTDITFVVERRTDAGAWERAERLVPGLLRPDPAAATRPPVREAWYDARNPELFALLCGLPSPRPLSPAARIAEPRGLPSDASAETLADHAGWEDDAFSASWLTASELIRFDWDQVVSWSFHAVPPDELRAGLDERRIAEARNHIAEHGWPPHGWHIAGDSRYGFRATTERTCASFALGFMPVIVRMVRESPHDLDAVRCIFWFDR